MEKENKLTFQNMFWYFIIFSIIGLIVETLFGYATTGNIDSRKGLLWGSFCPIYGVGAVILILFLDHCKNSDFKIFILGGILGGAIEYVISFILEAMYGSRFWDYTYLPFDINGRICIKYSIYWSILALILMKIIRPAFDKIISKMNERLKKILEIGLFVFLCVDVVVTVWAISIYKDRALAVYYDEERNTSQNELVQKIEEEYFTNERMLKTFPNLRIIDREGKDVFIRDILEE